MKSSYIKQITKLSYIEYSTPKKKTKNGKKKVDLTLLDLSLSESGEINRRLKKLITKDAQSIGRYHQTQDIELLKIMKSRLKTIPKKTLITGGCDGALRVITRLLIHGETKVLIPTPSFNRFEYHVKVNLGKIVFLPFSKFPYKYDVERIITEFNKQGCDVVIIANPNNPTGEMLSLKEISKILRGINGYLILDESLILDSKDSAVSLINRYPNLILCGSFSKLYGLAGMRIGFVTASRNIVIPLKTLLSPFEVASIGIDLAKDALKDKYWIDNKIIEIRKSLRLLSNIKSKNISVTPSQSLTIIIKSNKKENLYEYLYSRGIKTIDGKDFRSLEKENCVRISIKDFRSITKLVKVLESI